MAFAAGAYEPGPDKLLVKQKALLDLLRGLESVLVACSGGTDSAYLAWAAHEALGDRALAVTALSPSFSAYDRQQTEALIARLGLRHEFIETHELDNPLYIANNPDRCYYCKSELFTALDRMASDLGFRAVAYGANLDDLGDFRPGQRAAAASGVRAPLIDAGLHKAEIRELSRIAGLPSWDRPASACLSSRIPYGERITPGSLARIEQGEAALRALGFRQFRVRAHEKLARIEIVREELPRALTLEMASLVTQRLKELGFTFVTLDLEGYRQGSLNEVLGGNSGTSPAHS